MAAILSAHNGSKLNGSGCFGLSTKGREVEEWERRVNALPQRREDTKENKERNTVILAIATIPAKCLALLFSL